MSPARYLREPLAMPHTGPMTTSHIQAHVGYIVQAAQMGVNLGGMSPEAALDFAATAAKENATLARTRGGHWASETSTETIEEALFAGSVAKDILDGTVSRPSTGNVRAYALGLLEG